MAFSDITNYQVDLLNSVLERVGAKHIFQNKDFVVEQESMGYHQLVIHVSSKKRKSIPLTIYLEGDGLRLDVCTLSESFEWTSEALFKSTEKVKQFFLRLFTSYILMESCGSPNLKSRIYLFDSDGCLLERYAIRGVLQKYSGWDCDKLLFFPLY
jgi:hypothetical protein